MGEMTRLLVSLSVIKQTREICLLTPYTSLDRSATLSPSDMHFLHHRSLLLSIKCLRIPIVVAIILYIIASNVGSISTYHALIRAGATVLLAVYLLILSICIYTGLIFRRLTNNMSSTPFLLLALSLPFFFIRMLYLVLGAFVADNGAFVIIWGDWRIFVGMSLCMEAVLVACLAASGFTDDQEMAVLQGDVPSELVGYETEEPKVIQS